jgi:ribosomal protein S18 acetylase RimI-like enzyme
MKTALCETRIASLTDVEALAKTHDEAWRSTYRGVIPGSELEKIIARRGPSWWQSAISKGNRISLLSFNGEPAGYVNYGRNRAKGLAHQGEIYELYLRPEYMGMGFGTQLFEAARQDLQLHKLNSLVVWVLCDNSVACDFFKAMGGKPIARSSERFGTKTLDKTAFGWTS